MALFFDQDWFDARLRDLGRTQADVAAALGVSALEVGEIWKDQRELMPNEVAALARFFSVAPDEIVDRAGIATPVPLPSGIADDASGVLLKLDEMNGRLMKIERAITELKTLVLEQRRSDPPAG